MLSFAHRTLACIVSSILATLLSAAPAHAQMVGGQWETLWQFDGQASDDWLGYSVSGAGDVDGDGFDDLIVGAHGADPGGLSAAGSAYVYSGATGSLIWQFDGQASFDALGWSVSGAGDVDGDGFDDLIVGAHGADPGGLSAAGSAYVYSGATGSLIWQFDGQASGDNLGWPVSGAGDVDGDGFADVIVGAHWASPGGLTNAGSAYVYSLDPFLQTSADSISVSGAGNLQLDLDFPASEAGARYAVLASLAGTGPTTVAGLDIPLTQDALFNLMASGNAPPPLQGAYGTLDANAQAQATLQAGPALAPGIGRTVHFAAVTFDTGPTAGRMSSIVRYVEIVP
ncbi:MAG: FG-GAP repeat protein [Planctomycetes bacterium]|nr:FG-GAP repeat protein [Planctomycetota bacterium]